MTMKKKKLQAKKKEKEKMLLRPDSPFSYVCGQCRCCVDKLIKLNPYEVARLAANPGISTTEFIRTCTMAKGAVLKMNRRGECLFRTSKGCSVHPDRPLVCRLYPLGRHAPASSGEEVFSLLSEGRVGRDGTVADYLRTQEVGLHRCRLSIPQASGG
jgi:Fe-S-cluster containining protein